MNRRRVALRRQRGVSLIVALIVLAAVMVAGVAMYRSVTSGLGVAGNIGFRQNATSAADLGAEAGIAWVGVTSNTSVGAMDNDLPAYFASWKPDFDPKTYDWSNSTDVVCATCGSSTRIQYVVHRLCSTTGPASALGQSCVRPVREIQIDCGGGGSVEDEAGSSCTSKPMFRITSRVQGPRNTLSFVQVTMF